MVVWKAKNYFRIQIMVKIKNIIQFNRLFRKNIDGYLMKKIDKTNRLLIDADPVKMT
jgi:hypothetical protein